MSLYFYIDFRKYIDITLIPLSFPRVISEISCQDSGREGSSTKQDHSGLKLMKSSTHDSGEGSDPEESSQESMVTEIKMCVGEIQQTDGIAKNSKRWYKEFGFEEMDNDKTSVGKWTKCPAISWMLCLSMINTFYNEFRYKLSFPFRGHFRDVLYHFRSKVFENMRLRLICAQLAAQRSGKLKFELRLRRLIKL